MNTSYKILLKNTYILFFNSYSLLIVETIEKIFRVYVLRDYTLIYFQLVILSHK